MNNTFSISRFGLLVKRDILQNWKKYLLQVTALFGVIFIIFMWYSYSQYSYRNITYGGEVWDGMEDFLRRVNKQLITNGIIVFVIGLLISASMMMDPISSKRKRADYLTFPCSSLEKYLSRFLIRIIGFVVVFFVSFWLVDFVRVGVYSVIHPQFDIEFLDLGWLIDTGEGRGILIDIGGFTAALTVYTSVVAFFTLGSTFWQKNVLVKNIVAVVAVIFLYCGFVYVIANVGITDDNHWYNYVLIDKLRDPFIPIVLFFGTLSIFLWVLSYFRFKETEIINRW